MSPAEALGLKLSTHTLGLSQGADGLYKIFGLCKASNALQWDLLGPWNFTRLLLPNYELPP